MDGRDTGRDGPPLPGRSRKIYRPLKANSSSRDHRAQDGLEVQHSGVQCGRDAPKEILEVLHHSRSGAAEHTAGDRHASNVYDTVVLPDMLA